MACTARAMSREARRRSVGPRGRALRAAVLFCALARADLATGLAVARGLVFFFAAFLTGFFAGFLVLDFFFVGLAMVAPAVPKGKASKCGAVDASPPRC